MGNSPPGVVFSTDRVSTLAVLYGKIHIHDGMLSTRGYREESCSEPPYTIELCKSFARMLVHAPNLSLVPAAVPEIQNNTV